MGWRIKGVSSGDFVLEYRGAKAQRPSSGNPDYRCAQLGLKYAAAPCVRGDAELLMAEHAVEFDRCGGVESDGGLDAPAFHRNHRPIWAVLEKFLAGRSGDVLEAGSGTGQHVVHF